MYTSGTTGRPKGVVRTHESHISHYLLSNINMGVRPTDKVMLVMPMCHVNSIQYSFPYTLMTAPVFVYNMVSFDPEDLLTTIDKYQITYTSLVPTHYRMILDLPEEIKKIAKMSPPSGSCSYLFRAGHQGPETGHHGLFPECGALGGLREHGRGSGNALEARGSV